MSRPCFNYKFCIVPLRWFLSWRRLLENICTFLLYYEFLSHGSPLIFSFRRLQNYIFDLKLKVGQDNAIDDQELIIIVAVCCDRRSQKLHFFFTSKGQQFCIAYFNGPIFSYWLSTRFRNRPDLNAGLSLQWRLAMKRLSGWSLNQGHKNVIGNTSFAKRSALELRMRIHSMRLEQTTKGASKILYCQF